MTDWFTDEDVEKAAEAGWQSESIRCSDAPRRILWADENEQVRERWRVSTRASLSAVNPYEYRERVAAMAKDTFDVMMASLPASPEGDK